MYLYFYLTPWFPFFSPLFILSNWFLVLLLFISVSLSLNFPHSLYCLFFAHSVFISLYMILIFPFFNAFFFHILKKKFLSILYYSLNTHVLLFFLLLFFYVYCLFLFSLSLSNHFFFAQSFVLDLFLIYSFSLGLVLFSDFISFWCFQQIGIGYKKLQASITLSKH